MCDWLYCYRHRAVQCPTNPGAGPPSRQHKKRRFNRSRVAKCFNCGQPGHVKADCTNATVPRAELKPRAPRPPRAAAEAPVERAPRAPRAPRGNASHRQPRAPRAFFCYFCSEPVSVNLGGFLNIMIVWDIAAKEWEVLSSGGSNGLVLS